MKIKVFLSYSHSDEDLLKELYKHFSMLRHNELIEDWYDRKIVPGSDWKKDIDYHIKKADIILLLISADFLASEYCYGIEMKQALERRDKGKADVIAIILRSVDWGGTPFTNLQALPKDGLPVTSWNNKDEAFTDVSIGIKVAVENRIKLKEKQAGEDKNLGFEDAGKASEEVIINKYRDTLMDGEANLDTIKKKQNYAVFTVGATECKLGLEIAPYIKDGRTYLPVVYCAKVLGIPDSNILWDEDSRTLSVINGNKVIQFQVGNTTIRINGAAINMDVAAEFICGHITLPVVFIAAGLNCNVIWDAMAQTITIKPR
jgi:hypothetical protein